MLSRLAVIGSIACVVGWSIAFYSATVNNLLLCWLPLAPVGGLTTAYYVDGDISSLITELGNLETKKYNFKDV